MTDASNTVTEKYLTLPGGVLLTIRPAQTGNAQKTYNLPNIHGDIFATTDASGTLLGTTLTGPFGEPISGQTAPNNTANASSFGYVGKNEKFTESSFTLQPIQMGARVYIPGLGRFISVDPTQGGTDNNYVYASDPVNDFDLDGNLSWKGVANTASWASMLPGPAGMVASGIAAASYAAAGDRKDAVIACVGIAAAAVGAGVAVKAAKIAKDGDIGAKIAATAWSKGSQSSKAANLMVHFEKHGASMGYKSALQYTGGAIKNIASAKATALLKSGSRAFVNGNKVTLTYKAGISSFYKSRNATKWLRNVR